jgi:hypothetical protein
MILSGQLQLMPVDIPRERTLEPRLAPWPSSFGQISQTLRDVGPCVWPDLQMRFLTDQRATRNTDELGTECGGQEVTAVVLRRRVAWSHR